MSLVVDASHLGVPESVWLRPGVLDAVAATDLPACRSVVVVAPHPDDEVLGPGGCLRRLAATGTAVHLLAVTDGDGSHPRSPTLTPTALAARRVDETAEGLRRLGVDLAGAVRLTVPDGKVADHEDAVAAALTRMVEQAGAAVAVLAPWAHDGHRDHDACGRAARAVAAGGGCELWEYPLWAWHWATPGALPLGGARRVVLDRRTVAAKRWASGAYLTQVRPLGTGPGDEVILPQAVLRRSWRSFEILFPAGAGG
jgi:LmbE family N-acetylglucosaminyl deacetylase